MVSVIAVKIQFSSPRGVRLSLILPGMFLIRSLEMLLMSLLCWQNHSKAIFIGVVRQEVNRSAGYSAFTGRVSFAAQAARMIISFLSEF